MTAWLTVRAYQDQGQPADAEVGAAPIRFGTNMAWLAVRSHDPQRVLDQLYLNDVRAAGWADGLGAVYDRKTSDGAIFVTPAIDGWVLVVGPSLPQPLDGAFIDKCLPLLEDLGERFDDVQYFLSYGSLDLFAWARISGGRLRRTFAQGDNGVFWSRGTPTPEERALGLKFFEVRGIDDRDGDAGGAMILTPTEEQVTQLAARWSIDPGRVVAHSFDQGATGHLGSSPLTWRATLAARQAA